MKLSTLTTPNVATTMIDAFGGYNHNMRISENEFYDMKNLTSSYYPVLSPRDKRGTYTTLGSGNVRGLVAKDALSYVKGQSLYINNAIVENLVLTGNDDRQLISMGAYLIIMPDKIYVNTSHTSEIGHIENTTTNEIDGVRSGVTYTPCTIDGTAYANPGGASIPVQNTAPTNPVDRMYWVDTSSTPHVLKQYSASSSMWTPIATTYVKISFNNIAAGFSEYDGVKITGLEPSQLQDFNNQICILYGAYHNTTSGQEGVGDYIIITGMLDQAVVSSTASKVTISRNMPDTDFIIECNNRLWGCKYGWSNSANTSINEIYACKQGDFKNWNCFMGVSTDSYAASCGTEGEWTGAINYLGYPLFFKENFMHKVYGSYPAQYQITVTPCRGVMKGAGKSLAIVNETLFYKSRNGVCAYEGSLPSEVSSYLGGIRYSAVDTTSTDVLRNGAVAGAFGGKYYISMRSEVNNTWYLFVYDTTFGMWHKEDEIRVLEFCNCRNELYFLDSNRTVKTVFGSGTKDTSKVQWEAETGILGTDRAGKKYISRVLIRMMMPMGSRVRFMIEYDSSGDWEQVTELIGQNLRTFPFTLRPKRCDHFKLKLVGEGEVKVYSITKTLEEGSDV